MSRRIRVLAAFLLCGVLALGCAGCLFESSEPNEPAASSIVMQPTTSAAMPQPDPEVSQTLRAFYQNDLPGMALRSGIENADGEEIRCTISMLRKTIFADFDADEQKEIILLYDITEQTKESGMMNVAVFLDEQDGQPMVASVEPGTYGASKDGESHILTRYNNQICKVRFLNQAAYEAVLIDTYQNGAWHTVLSAYRHVSDHDSVKLENDSCYIDHAGADLFKAAVTRELTYSKEKFLNFRTPNDNYNNLVTSLLAETMLP